jgi:hypothetical protein
MLKQLLTITLLVLMVSTVFCVPPTKPSAAPSKPGKRPERPMPPKAADGTAPVRRAPGTDAKNGKHQQK